MAEAKTALRAAQVARRVPAEPHDAPVDLLLTESMALVCQR